jgi:integrase
MDENRAVLIVPGTKTEAASRFVPMTPRPRDILQRRQENTGKKSGGWVFPAKKADVGRIVPNTFYQPHFDALQNSGICERKFVLYALRHTCLSRWGASGMDAWTLARLAGHSNIEQSMTYVHPTVKSLHTVIERMSAQVGDKIGHNAEMLVFATESELRVLETPVNS